MMVNYLGCILLITIALIGSGCSSIRPVRSYTPEINYEKETVQNYEIGQTKKIYIGENIIEKGNVISEEITSGQYKAIRDMGNCFQKDHIYRVICVDQQDGSLYIEFCGTNMARGVRVNKNGEILDEHMFYYNLGGWQNHLGVSVGATLGEKVFEPLSNTIKAGKGSFKIEIIYSGLDENNLKATYREYKDDIARPAFYQDLVYNLGKSDIIRYKQFKIKVLEATNEGLEYVVLED
jgi:hypothetical protein